MLSVRAAEHVTGGAEESLADPRQDGLPAGVDGGECFQRAVANDPVQSLRSQNSILLSHLNENSHLPNDTLTSDHSAASSSAAPAHNATTPPQDYPQFTHVTAIDPGITNFF